MATLNDKEKAALEKKIETINALNRQILDYTKAQYKACELQDEAEKSLQEFYEKLSKKYNEGNPISINIENGEVSPIEDKQEE